MAKEWISGREGRNLKFKRETLLNWAMNRWGFNKAYSVGPTSELIRQCTPKTFEQWETFYFDNATQKKRNGMKITREYITDLGRKLYVKPFYFDNATQKKRNGMKITREYITDLGRKLYVKHSEVVQNELESIEEQECIDYAYNLVLNRTYEGYRSEIDTVYGQLEELLEVKIHPAPDEWDRLYNVDFYIEVEGKYIGLQIKPITFEHTFEDYKWKDMQRASHLKFQEKFGGKVFTVFSIKSGKKKEIYNKEVIEEIKKEIKRLQDL